MRFQTYFGPIVSYMKEARWHEFVMHQYAIIFFTVLSKCILKIITHNCSKKVFFEHCTHIMCTQKWGWKVSEVTLLFSNFSCRFLNLYYNSSNVLIQGWRKAWNFFFRSLEHFFLTVEQNNFGTKIPKWCNHIYNFHKVLLDFQNTSEWIL